MKNTISSLPGRLATQMSAAIPGVVKYGAALGLREGLAESLTMEGAALDLAINAREQGKLAARNSVAVVRLKMKSCRSFVAIVRELVKPTVGGKYSQLWDAFGFNGNLRIPSKVDGMLELLAKMAGHLAAHPELANTEANVNAAYATALRSQLLNAKTAVNEKKGDLQRLLEARGVRIAAGRFLLRGLSSELRLKLTPLDSRWVEFGFNKLGAQPTPPVPEGVTAVLIGSNAISIKWPPITRAEYCRIWVRVIGVNAELGSVGTSSDLDFLLEQLPGNSQVEVALSAVNSGGESGKSAVVIVQTL